MKRPTSHLSLNVLLQQLDEAPQVRVDPENVQKPTVRALDVVVGSVGMHVIHVPY